MNDYPKRKSLTSVTELADVSQQRRSMPKQGGEEHDDQKMWGFRDQWAIYLQTNENDTGADVICNAVQNTHIGQQIGDSDRRRIQSQVN